MEEYSRQRHVDAGYEFVYSPHITKGELFEISGHLGFYKDGHVPAHARGRGAQRRRQRPQARPGLLPEADELPDALPDLPLPRSVLPRAAAAAVRVRLGLPVRDVRRGARSDPGAGDDAGRRAHLLHRGPDAGRAEVAAAVRAGPAQGLRPGRLLPGAVHPGPGEVDRHRRGVGARDPRPGAGGRGVRSRSGARSRRRRVLRPEDLRPGPRRHRPHLADVDHPGRPDAAGAVRAGVHRHRRHPAAPGDDPPRPVRLGRAVRRRAHRALRRRLPALAVAGPGGRHPGGRGLQRLPGRGGATGCARPGCGSRSTPATTGCRRRSGPPSSRRCRSC